MTGAFLFSDKVNNIMIVYAFNQVCRRSKKMHAECSATGDIPLTNCASLTASGSPQDPHVVVDATVSMSCFSLLEASLSSVDSCHRCRINND